MFRNKNAIVAGSSYSCRHFITMLTSLITVDLVIFLFIILEVTCKNNIKFSWVNRILGKKRKAVSECGIQEEKMLMSVHETEKTVDCSDMSTLIKLKMSVKNKFLKHYSIQKSSSCNVQERQE